MQPGLEFRHTSPSLPELDLESRPAYHFAYKFQLVNYRSTDEYEGSDNSTTSRAPTHRPYIRSFIHISSRSMLTCHQPSFTACTDLFRHLSSPFFSATPSGRTREMREIRRPGYYPRTRWRRTGRGSVELRDRQGRGGV